MTKLNKEHVEERAADILASLTAGDFDRIDDALLEIDELRAGAEPQPLPAALELEYERLRAASAALHRERPPAASRPRPALATSSSVASPPTSSASSPPTSPPIDEETGPRLLAAVRSGAMTIEQSADELMKALRAIRGCVRVPPELEALHATLPRSTRHKDPAPPPCAPLPPPDAEERRTDRIEAKRIVARDALGLELWREQRKTLHAVAGVRFELAFELGLEHVADLERGMALVEELGRWAGAPSFRYVNKRGSSTLVEAGEGAWATMLKRFARAPDFEAACLADLPTPESIPNRALHVSLDRRVHNRRGLLRLTLPWPASDWGDVRERFLGACDGLPATFASAGPRLHLSSSLALGPRESLSRRVFPLLLRHPALGYPLPSSFVAGPAVPGFLTMVSHERAGERKLEEWVRELTAGPSVTAHPLRRGCAVQAGEVPELGAEGSPPPAFAHVVRVLRPVIDARVPHDCLPGISVDVLRGLAARMFEPLGG